VNVISKLLSREFFIYLTVGGVTFLVYISVAWLAMAVMHSDYRVGVSVGYLFAAILHFLANRTFTFRAGTHHLANQLIRYVGLLILNYLITLMVVSFCVGRLGLSPYLSATLGVVLTVGVGYSASKLWVFRKSELLHD